jgi:CBS domain-containing protein
MNIGELCSRDLVSVASGAPLMEVARAMRDEHVGIVVITKSPADEPVAAGVITDRDLARLLLERAGDIGGMCAEDVMTRDPLVLCEHDAVETAILRLRERGVRRAPVVTARGRLLGIISTDDLIAHVAGELSGLARLFEQQPAHESVLTRRAARPGGSFTGAGHGI